MDLFELVGTIVIKSQDAERALDETAKKAGKTKNSLQSAFSGIGKGAVVVGKTIVSGLAVGATAVTGLVASSVKAYADYEQLVGGAQLMFGDAYDYIADKAANAYSTVQMSQSDYLQQVNGFATGLKTALGGNEQAAAELADRIITAEADVVAATGNTQENVQNAFNGIMKSNFTMLDNLQIGITPTKEGFQEVIDKVNEWNKANGEATDYQIENLADCQSALLDYIEMQGLAGYASKEASGTISGSIAMTKAAWENLTVGLAQDNADIPQLVTNVISSGTQVLENIIPVAKQVLQSIPIAISEISPEAGAAFQKVIDIVMAALPILKDAITTTFDIIKNAFTFISEHTGLLAGVATAIGIVVTALGLYNAVAAVKAAMAAAEVTTVWGLVAAYAAQAAAMIAALAPYLLIAAAIAAVIAIIVVCVKHWDQIKEAAVNAWQWICDAWGKAGEWFNTNVIQPIINFFTGLWDGIVNIWDGICNAVQTAWDGICNAVQVGIMLIGTIISAAFQIITLPWRFIWENTKEYVFAAWEAIKTAVSNAINAVKTVITNVMNAISAFLTPILNSIKNTFTTIWNAIKSAVTTAVNAAKSVVTSVWNSIKSVTTSVFNAVKSVATSVWNGIKSTITGIVNGIKSTVTSVWNGIKSTATSVWNGIKSAITKPIDAAKTHIKNAVSAIERFFSGMKIKFPSIKLPHFSISGSLSLDPPSVPKISVEWYKKAMNEPFMFTKPTLFDYNPLTGMARGAGEAGDEVMIGKNTMLSMIQQAVANENSVTMQRLERIIELMVQFFPDALEAMKTPMVLDPDGAAVALAPAMNKQLGKIAIQKGRGR